MKRGRWLGGVLLIAAYAGGLQAQDCRFAPVEATGVAPDSWGAAKSGGK